MASTAADYRHSSAVEREGTRTEGESRAEAAAAPPRLLPARPCPAAAAAEDFPG